MEWLVATATHKDIERRVEVFPGARFAVEPMTREASAKVLKTN